jgi:hypothetical protein
MSALGVQGDPDGWQGAGYTIRAVAGQLANELDIADASGGGGLRRSWYGPMSEAYQSLWSQRYGRYGDLVYQAGRAATALIDFGEALIGLQQLAWNLERQWLGLGLHLSADGFSFALPFGHESLAQEAQAALRASLGESERDIEAMWNDIRAAVGDLVTVLESVLDALGDYSVIELGAIGWTASAVWKGMGGPLGLVQSAMDQLDAYTVRTAADLRSEADGLKQAFYQDGDRGVRAAVIGVEDDADQAVRVAGQLDRYVKFGDKAFTAIAIGLTAADTYGSIRKQGVDSGLEQNAGNWASLAVGLGIGAVMGSAAVVAAVAAAPVLVGVGVGVGAVAVTAIVSVGVGNWVQSSVDHHKKGSTRVLNDLGQGVENASVWGATETHLIPGPAI